jgi:hypothetical protein
MKANIKVIEVKFVKTRVEIGTSTEVDFCNYLENNDFNSSLEFTFNFL